MKIIQIILFLLIFYGGESLGNDTLQIERIRFTIELMPKDSSRLDFIHKEAMKYQGSEFFGQLSTMLYRDAIMIGNNKYSSIGSYYMVVESYNQNDSAAIYEWLDKLSAVALEEKMYYEYFNGKRYLVHYYSRNEAFEKAINIALKIKREAVNLDSNEGLIAANIALANTYNASDQCENGCEVLEETLPLIGKDDLIEQLDICVQLLSGYDFLENNGRCLKYLDVLKGTLEKMEKTRPGTKQSFFDTYLFREIIFAKTSMRLNNFDEAQKHIVHCEEYLDENTFFMYRSLYHDTCTDLYAHNGEYDKAILHNDKSIDIIREIYATNYINLLAKKADLLVLAGRSYEAAVIYQTLLPASDSIFYNRSETQLTQIRENYNYEKAQYRIEQNKSNIQGLLLIFFISTLLALVLFSIKLWEIRHKIRKSKEEIEEATRTVDRANDMKALFLKSISHDIRTPLNAVVGFTELLTSNKKLPAETRAEYGDIVKKNSEELMLLVNNVLDLSRLEAGMMKFNIQDCDVLSLCYEAIHMPDKLQNSMSVINFETEVEELIISTDTNRFSHMLRSILHTTDEETPANISFSLKLEERKQQLWFKIVGAPLANMKRSTHERQVSNEINRLFVERFNGEYRIVNDMEEGAVIHITYPIK